MAEVENILNFWFGEDGKESLSKDRLDLWFGGKPEVDRLIQNNFETDVRQARQGRLDSWQESPRTALALILLLDQFPRNIYRHSPLAYASDDKAVQVALQGLAEGRDRFLGIIERAFFYLPLEHAEEPSLQERSVTAFEHLMTESPPELRQVCGSFLDYAVRHRDIIRRFGRFPHRNLVLGRPSTQEETEFLKEPGSSF